MDILGDSLEKIASEKAGIIKQGVPVVIGESTAETKNIFLEKAKETGSAIHFANEEFAIQSAISSAETIEIEVRIIQEITKCYRILQICFISLYSYVAIKGKLVI